MLIRVQQENILVKMIPHDEIVNVAQAMIKYGGSFVESLGKALLQADHINAQKIKDTWPEYWKKYLEMSKTNGGDLNGT